VVDHPILLAVIVLTFVVFGVVVAYVGRIAARRPEMYPAE